MTLYERLKDDINRMRKLGGQHSAWVPFMQTFMSEAERLAKDEQRDVIDADIIQTARKFKKNAETCVEALTARPEASLVQFMAEIAMVEEYIPSDPFANMSGPELVAHVRDVTDEENPNKIAAVVMKAARGRFKFPDVKIWVDQSLSTE